MLMSNYSTKIDIFKKMKHLSYKMVRRLAYLLIVYLEQTEGYKLDAYKFSKNMYDYII